MLRNAVAVIVGFVLWAVLWLAANRVLMATVPSSFDDDGVTNDELVMVVAILLSVVFSLLAGYVTATVARVNRMKPVLILAVIQVVIGIIVEVNYWTEIPVWYHVTFLVLLAPSILVGGRLALKRQQAAATG